MISPTGAKASSLIDSPTAWLRLGVAVLLSTIGGVGMWSYMVALPAIQADFGVSRADASLPFTMVMFGFAGGGVLMGRLADRFGIALPLGIGTLALTGISRSDGRRTCGWSHSRMDLSESAVRRVSGP
jgi:MFS family permease